MSEAAIDKRLGLAPGERASRYPNTRVFNHAWKDPSALKEVGTLSAHRVSDISGGRITTDVRITVNRLVYEYDVVLIVGPTFPHEVVGFSGGNKYLFPGISGQEIIDMFHWLGALFTSPVVIGRKQTAVRRVVDAAAAMLPTPRLCMSLVVTKRGLHGVYAGTPEEAWSAAADHSASLHIVQKSSPFRSVLSCPAAMYDELWVAAKAAYKLEPVVADGGELIVYAPELTEISLTHGALIRSIGYHVRDYFASRMEKFSHIPGGILAHSTHVKGVGTYANGTETPRIRVTLATGIPRATCEEINLGYRDPASIDVKEWMGREDEGRLHVPDAGETLFRLAQDPFPEPA
jgi:nickel-dependent lactate racemase